MIADQRYQLLLQDRVLRDTLQYIFQNLQELEVQLQKLEIKAQVPISKPVEIKPIDTTALAQQILTAVLAEITKLKGTPNGLATLGTDGKLVFSQLPSEAIEEDYDGGIF